MLGWDAVVVKGCGLDRIIGYMYSGDTRQQQQHCMHVRTDISASLVTPHFSKRSASQLASRTFLRFHG
jgi:hypothetical protein